jgi:hypothetical protein
MDVQEVIYRSLGVPDIVANKDRAAGAAMFSRAQIRVPDEIDLYANSGYAAVIDVGGSIVSALVEAIEAGDLDANIAGYPGQRDIGDITDRLRRSVEEAIGHDVASSHIAKMTRAAVDALIEHVRANPFAD